MPSVTDGAASLLDADPSLATALGARRAARVGLALVLPVLALPAGPWQPPARERLGHGTRALVVLSGLIACGSGRLAGPGDVIEPWDPDEEWTACTSVRLAVIGDAYHTALRDWPRAAERLHERDVPAEPWRRCELRNERVLALLWHLATRWGEPDAGGVRLLEAVDATAIGYICVLTADDTAAALDAAGGLDQRRGGWVLRETAASPTPADELRARMAEAFADARVVHRQYIAGMTQLHSD